MGGGIHTERLWLLGSKGECKKHLGWGSKSLWGVSVCVCVKGFGCWGMCEWGVDSLVGEVCLCSALMVEGCVCLCAYECFGHQRLCMNLFGYWVHVCEEFGCWEMCVCGYEMLWEWGCGWEVFVQLLGVKWFACRGVHVQTFICVCVCGALSIGYMCAHALEGPLVFSSHPVKSQQMLK